MLWRSMAMDKLVRKITQLETVRAQTLRYCFSSLAQDKSYKQSDANTMPSHENQFDSPKSRHSWKDASSVRHCIGENVPRNDTNTIPLNEDGFDSPTKSRFIGKDVRSIRKHQIGENVPRKDKVKFLVDTLVDLKDDKEAVYGALDAWVAWEQKFPIGPIKMAIQKLEKEQQWHRVVQVIKWMLSKGQGNTMRTYEQLIRALDMDHRAEEAQEIWVNKVGRDFHSVPWQVVNLMIAVYYRNNMLENIVKLFKGMEAFERKPRDKTTVQKVADAYEMLGLLEEKDKVLEKYNHLFTDKKDLPKKKRKPGGDDLHMTGVDQTGQ